MQTCQGKTKAGVACRAPAGLGGLCFFHANPDSARALGQLGGKKNRRSVVDLQVPDNMTTADICHVTALPSVHSVRFNCRSRSADNNAGRAIGSGRKRRFLGPCSNRVPCRRT